MPCVPMMTLLSVGGRVTLRPLSVVLVADRPPLGLEGEAAPDRELLLLLPLLALAGVVTTLSASLLRSLLLPLLGSFLVHFL